jgi:predicted nucleotidyltransferase
MNHTLQLGDKQVDGASLGEVCRRYGVKELSPFGSAVRSEMSRERYRHHGGVVYAA